MWCKILKKKKCSRRCSFLTTLYNIHATITTVLPLDSLEIEICQVSTYPIHPHAGYILYI